MAESVEYTEEQIEAASYPDLLEHNLTTSKIPLGRMDSQHGRVYFQKEVKESDRTYIYSSTTILDNVLDKGYGFRKWLGDSLSMEHAERYAQKRADVGSAVHALCMYLIWGYEIDCRNGYYLDEH